MLTIFATARSDKRDRVPPRPLSGTTLASTPASGGGDWQSPVRDGSAVAAVPTSRGCDLSQRDRNTVHGLCFHTSWPWFFIRTHLHLFERPTRIRYGYNPRCAWKNAVQVSLPATGSPISSRHNVLRPTPWCRSTAPVVACCLPVRRWPESATGPTTAHVIRALPTRARRLRPQIQVHRSGASGTSVTSVRRVRRPRGAFTVADIMDLVWRAICAGAAGALFGQAQRRRIERRSRSRRASPFHAGAWRARRHRPFPAADSMPLPGEAVREYSPQAQERHHGAHIRGLEEAQIPGWPPFRQSEPGGRGENPEFRPGQVCRGGQPRHWPRVFGCHLPDGGAPNAISLPVSVRLTPCSHSWTQYAPPSNDRARVCASSPASHRRGAEAVPSTSRIGGGRRPRWTVSRSSDRDGTRGRSRPPTPGSARRPLPR